MLSPVGGRLQAAALYPQGIPGPRANVGGRAEKGLRFQNFQKVFRKFFQFRFIFGLQVNTLAGAAQNLPGVQHMPGQQAQLPSSALPPDALKRHIGEADFVSPLNQFYRRPGQFPDSPDRLVPAPHRDSVRQTGQTLHGGPVGRGDAEHVQIGPQLWFNVHQPAQEETGNSVVMFRQLQQIDIAGQKSFHHAVSRKPLHIPRPDVEQHAQRIAAHALRRGRKFPAQPLFQTGTAEETGGAPGLGYDGICALSRDRICALSRDRICTLSRDRICALGHNRICALGHNHVCALCRDRICALSRDRICALDHNRICAPGHNRICALSHNRICALSRDRICALGHNRICALPPIHPRPQSHFQHPIILPVQNLPRQNITSPDHRLRLQGWPRQCTGQPCL